MYVSVFYVCEVIVSVEVKMCTASSLCIFTFKSKFFSPSLGVAILVNLGRKKN